MKNKIKIISLVFFLLFSLTFISALSFDWADFTYPIKQGDCFNVFTTCENCSYMNITILFPNGTSIIENEAMTNLSSHYYYNYSFCDTSVLGIYPVLYYYDSEYGSESSGDFFEITPSGNIFSQGQSTAGLGIILGALAIAFFFMFFGFKLSENEKLFPLTILFILLSFLFIIYSLHLSYVYTIDILQYESLGNVSSTVYISVLWILVSVAVLSTILILISSIKAMGEASKKKQYGEGFNPVTNTYDF